MTGLTTSPPAGPHAARPGLVGCSPSLIVTGSPRGDGRSQRERPASHGALDAAACSPVLVAASSVSTGHASRPGPLLTRHFIVVLGLTLHVYGCSLA